MPSSEISETFEFMQKLHEELNGSTLPQIAGPPTWNYLHTLAKLTPPNKSSQEAGFDTVKQVIATFPCKSCSEHGTEYLNTHPFDGNLQKYLCDFHNTVNGHLDKPVHSCDVNLSQKETPIAKEILSRGHGILQRDNGETLVEATPYIGGDIGISFPLGPLPGAPSIDFALSNDFPYTIFPIPTPVLNRMSDPWSYERPPTPRELMNESIGKKDKK